MKIAQDKIKILVFQGNLIFLSFISVNIANETLIIQKF